MNRSTIDAEVEYHLKMQERERLQGVVAEPEARQPGLVSRLLTLLRKRRAPAGEGHAAPHPEMQQGKEDEAQPRLGWR
jgi:hypothetical protein